MDGTGKTVLSTSNPYAASLSSNSTTEDSPASTKFIAKFGQALVTVSSSNTSWGSAAISILENKVGDQITLTAKPTNPTIWGTFFTGWSKEGSDEIISKEKSYTFTITDENKGKYIANFKQNPAEANHGGYYRIVRGGRYLWMTGDGYVRAVKKNSDGTIADGFNGYIFLHSITCPETTTTLVSSDVTYNYETYPGTVLYFEDLSEKNNLGDVNFKSQGLSMKDFVKASGFDIAVGGSYSSLSQKAKFAAAGAAYLKDGDNYGGRVGKTVIICGGDSDNDFYLYPITEETVDDSYFGVKPNTDNTVTENGETRYYTTLKTSFPYKCYEKDGVKAYIVDKLNETTGVAHLQEISEVPANTAVILSCKSTKAKENRLIPLLTTPTTDVSSNKLLGVIDVKHIDSNGNLKAESEWRTPFNGETMRVLKVTDGKLTMVNTYADAKGNAYTYLATNTAYLPVSSSTPATVTFGEPETPTAEEMTLKEAVSTAATNNGKLVKLTGERLQAVEKVTKKAADGTSTSYLVVKDADGQSNELTKKSDASVADYAFKDGTNYYTAKNGTAFSTAQSAYPQSNWILVQPKDANELTKYTQYITSITGTLKTDGDLNYLNDATIEGKETKDGYNPSYYCPINFLAGANTGNVQALTNKKGTVKYFFMNPKPGEYAQLIWARYSGNTTEDGKYVFDSDYPLGEGETYNKNGGVAASFLVDMSMNTKGDAGENGVTFTPTSEKVYDFQALIGKRASTGSSARKRAATQSGITVYALNLSDQVVTAVQDVEAARQVESVTYYNVAGQASARPYRGINIVVTKYSDGSTTAKKVVSAPL